MLSYFLFSRFKDEFKNQTNLNKLEFYIKRESQKAREKTFLIVF